MKKIAIFILILAWIFSEFSPFFFLSGVDKAYAADWLSGWGYRKKITITGQTGASTNYQTKLLIGENSGATGENFDLAEHSTNFPANKNDGGDLRFTDNDGNTLLSFWVESVTGSSPNRLATVWVKVKDSLETNTDIYIYYEKSGASNASNIEDTFIFADNFDDNSFDTNKWNKRIELGTITEQNGRMENGGGITSGGYGHTALDSKSMTNFRTGIIEGSMYLAANAIVEVGFRGGADNSGYKARADARTNEGVSNLKPPYAGWNFLANGGVSGIGIGNGTWKPFKITVYDDGTTCTMQIIVDGQTKNSSDTSYSAQAGRISLQNHYGSYVYYDDIRVRTYVATEPAFSSVSTEESSGTYSLFASGIGAGAITNSSSTHYLLQAIIGEIETASLSSTNFRLGPGLTYILDPHVPPAPTLSNPSNYYNKLKIVIDTGGNSTDTTYAISISTDNFVSDINYVQADNTLGSSIFFQDYVSWGEASPGTTIIDLTQGVTYYARVAARRGTFQQGSFGAVASAATINSTLTFSLQITNQTVPPFTVGIGNLNSGQVTTSWQKITTTISTNANNGGIIYLNDVSGGLVSATAGNYKIDSVADQNDLSGLLEGYGARGVSVSGAPMELVYPYNGDGNTVGIVDASKRVFADSTQSPVTNGSASFELQAKASTTTPAAIDYADIITVVATGSF